MTTIAQDGAPPPKKPVGRPPKLVEPVTINLSLDAATIAGALALGGSVSEGVRAAVLIALTAKASGG